MPQCPLLQFGMPKSTLGHTSKGTSSIGAREKGHEECKEQRQEEDIDDWIKAKDENIETNDDATMTLVSKVSVIVNTRMKHAISTFEKQTVDS